MQKRNVSYSEEFEKLVEYLAAGRTLEEQIESCEKTGNHALPAILRTGLLRSIGVPEPKANAENFMIWSCYVPFWSSMKLRDTVKLLNLLGVEYNYSGKEICCGAPMMQDAIELVEVTEERRKKILAKTQGFMQHNVDLAEQAGQKTMVYACQVCACLAKKAFPNEPDRHRYIYDPIMDKLEERDLKIAPTVMGFFEGCHRFFPYNSNLDWKRYRKLLGRVKGLEVVDMSQKLCCKQDSDGILAEAEKKNLSTIVAPDGDCHHMLKTAAAAKGKIEIKNLPEVLLAVLGQ
jgi:hypothetical protein